MFAQNQKMWSKCYQGAMLIILIGLTVTIFFVAGADVDDYWTRRDEFIKQEESRVVGSKIELNELEKIVNEILMEHKWKEVDEGFENPKSFIPANHIFETLDRIEKSEVFQFIQKLPKGSMLHGHDTALVSGDFLYELTFKPDLYTCYDGTNIKLKFFKVPDSTCAWEPIASMRESDANFDENLKSQLTLITPDFRTKHTDINTVWNLFMDIFILIDPLVCYKPVFEEYFYQVLQELYNDNVMYLEFRSTLPEVYDLDGNIYGSVEVAGIYKKTLDTFMESHPDFIGAKLIYAPVRQVDNETMDNYMDITLELAEKYPTFLAGFDLVGQEDLGQPLKKFINQLLKINSEISFYFHAGETNWYGTSTDFNLIDAVLLGTKRIGHGYAILKHPDVAEKVKQDGIAIEISPISNQVLMLVSDLRNHPGNYFISDGYPVVITNDDPSFWGTKALSYDWYMAFMGMTSRNTDLRFLKQIALNSIVYSSISDKNYALAEWEKRWNHFLTTIVETKVRSFPKVFVH